MRAGRFHLTLLAGLILAAGALACATPVTITIGGQPTSPPSTPTLISLGGPATAGSPPTPVPADQSTEQATDQSTAPADQSTDSAIDQSTDEPTDQATVPPDQASEDTQHLDTVTEEAATFEAVVVPTPLPPTPDTGSATINAGIQGQYFQTYTIQVSPGWVAAHETNAAAPSDKLTLTKDGYSLVIEQAGQGIEACLYGGQPTPTGDAHLWVVFSNVGFITGAAGGYLRGTNDGLSYTVCSQSGSGYNSVTPFGAITYTAPDTDDSPDPAVLADMDGMVASITH